MNIVRLAVLCLGLIGSVIFIGAFAASWVTPHFISKTAREVIRYRVAQEMNEKIDALGAEFLVEKAKILTKDKADEIERIKLLVKAKVPELVAVIANQMRDPDCPCRKWTPEPFRNFLLAMMADAGQAQERLAGLIKSKYLEVETKITREFRIFTGTNAVAFILLVLAVLVRPMAQIQLLPSAVILFAATVLCSYFYLFNQNWLHTIVFSDYVGFAYAAYLAVVFALLWDILRNNARVTEIVLNAILAPFTAAC